MDMVLLSYLKKYVAASMEGAGAVKGKDGRGISETEIDENQHLVITYDDGDTEDLGAVLTAQDKSDIADLVLAELPTAESIEV